MNRLQKGVVALLGFGMLTSLSAVQFEIMPTVGKKIRNKDTTLDDSKVLMGIRGTAYVTPNVGIQAVAESSLNNPTAGGGETDIERGSLNVIYEKSTNGRIKPYIMAGAGYEWTHGNAVKQTDDDSQPFANAGIGVKFGIKENLNLVTEVKGIHKFENGDDDIIGTVGLGMKIGAPVQKKPTCGSGQKALSLDEFSKMCKTKTAASAAAIVSDKPVAVESLQQQPAVTGTVTAVQEVPVVTQEVGTTCRTEESAAVSAGTEEAQIPEGYYVQMAALFKSNGEILTAKLEQKNYPYVLYNTQRAGKDVTLVLVGPYNSKQEAAVARKYLRRLARGAFVKKFP